MPHFIIISPGRSASTTVRTTINSAPDVLCHGEILGQARVIGVVSDWKFKNSPNLDVSVQRRSADPAGFCKDLLEDPPFETIGFKALYDHFFQGVGDDVLNRFLAHKPQVVFLWRRNLVARFLSRCRKRMLENKRLPERFAGVSEDQIIADAKKQMQMARDIRARLDDMGCTDILEVDFEDLISGPQAMHDVMTFLNLSDSGYQILTDERTLRNKTQGVEIETPASFSADAVQPFTNVSLKQALQMV